MEAEEGSGRGTEAPAAALIIGGGLFSPPGVLALVYQYKTSSLDIGFLRELSPAGQLGLARTSSSSWQFESKRYKASLVLPRAPV